MFKCWKYIKATKESVSGERGFRFIYAMRDDSVVQKMWPLPFVTWSDSTDINIALRGSKNHLNTLERCPFNAPRDLQ